MSKNGLTSAAAEPRWRTVPQAQAELGGCSRSYVYALVRRGLLESVNPGGKRRLISSESIRKLAERAS
jgi:excisionase family DNA binding protein